MTVTPLIRHYLSIKEQYPEALVLYQVGDFYELFFDDAQVASQALAIALTARGTAYDKPIPLCGVPVHTLDHHLAKLIAAGFRVVIVEQLTAPQPGRLVERGVTRVLTPGTLVDSQFLKSDRASYCAAVHVTEYTAAIILVELLTGEVGLLLMDRHDDRLIEAEIARYKPDEILINEAVGGSAFYHQIERQGYVITRVAGDDIGTAVREWVAHWPESAQHLVERSTALSVAVNCMYRYLCRHQPQALSVCRSVSILLPDSFLIMDQATQENLEITDCFKFLDRTATAMGGRLLRKWAVTPLQDRAIIEQRQNLVERAIKNPIIREEVVALLKQIGDLERVVGRIALRRADIEDYKTICRAVEIIEPLSVLIKELFGDESRIAILPDVADLSALLKRALNRDAGSDFKIASGYDNELDRLRELIKNGVDSILAIEQKEQDLTRIPSLKIRYHQAYGYAIEVAKGQVGLVPDRYHKLQELSNRYRYTSDELRSIEYEMTRVRNSASAREDELFLVIESVVYEQRNRLRICAALCAQYDVLISLATVAHHEGYVRPEFHDSRDIIIKDSCHPLIAVKSGKVPVPNDVNLSDSQSLVIITGPNMGGKSTYLKQVALTIIMAQIGSFVPARSALLPIVDRIFTRIGAADKLSEGKSTFFVEMEETALICMHATEKSLVILDEVGRGTSSYDGLAIAQAVVEYIHDSLRAKSLFATHYHELPERVMNGRGIATYHAASRETDTGIVLLHKILPGTARGSYGIDVARSASLPLPIVLRAQEILTATPKEKNSRDSIIVFEELVDLNCDELTPRQAHDILSRMAEKIRNIHQV